MTNDERLRLLRAAAPELLTALQWAMSTGRLTYSVRIPNQNEGWCDAVDRAHAAIAKATVPTGVRECD